MLVHSFSETFELLPTTFHFHFAGERPDPTFPSRVCLACVCVALSKSSNIRSFVRTSHFTHVSISHPPLQSAEHYIGVPGNNLKNSTVIYNSSSKIVGSNSTPHVPLDRNCRRSHTSQSVVFHDFIDATCEQ